MLDSDVIIITTHFSCLLTVLDIILKINNISLTDMTLHVYIIGGSCKDVASRDILDFVNGTTNKSHNKLQIFII